jgi:hypothetical protein
LSSNIVTVFTKDSAVFEVASKTPEIGFDTTPTIPLIVPKKKPETPLF